MNSRIRLAGSILALAAVYFCSGILGLSMAFLNKSASAVWPPSGLCLAALLLWGYRMWPGVFLGAFLVNFFTQGTLATTLGIATGNTLEALLGTWLVMRFAGGPGAFERTRSFFLFVLVAAIGSTMVSAAVGVSSLYLGGFARGHDCGEIWLTWWLGDLVSDLIVAPLVVIWAAAPVRIIERTRIIEAACLALALLGIGGLVFFIGTPLRGLHPSLEYLTIPPLLWAAFRFGQRGAITAAAVMASVALMATAQGRGPFAQQDPNRTLILLQGFIGAITITALVMASVVSESRRAEQRLQIQDAVSRGLAEASNLSEAAPRVLQALCQEGHWDCAAIWILEPTLIQLVCAEFWYRPNLEMAEFEAVSRTTRFSPRDGLPGRVWDRRRPIFLRDLGTEENCPRVSAALKAGLQSGYGFAIKLGEEAPGVIEGYSFEGKEPDEEFGRMLEAIGSQVGQFLERKRAEAAQLRLAAIVESSADAIIGLSLQGIITSWNSGAERIYGYLANEAVGKSISLIFPAEVESQEAEIRKRIGRGERIQSYHTQRLRKDRELIDVSVTISPIKDAGGMVVGASKIARDITEQKRAERALVEAREMLRRHADDLERRVEERTAKLQDTIRSLDAFCYSIAHDLRAPLRAMMGFSVELLDRYQSLIDEEGKDFLHRIRNAGTRMDQLILDLLKLGRLNTADLVMEEVGLGEVLHKIMIELQNEIELRKARIQLQEPLHAVQASPIILGQVLANLLSNALKFISNDTTPQVCLWTELRDGMVRIWVKDNGIGIDAQHLSKLFQPFSRIVSDREFPGTGIGLAIVSKGVERMGGRVGVDSEPGQGSCFWIELRSARE